MFLLLERAKIEGTEWLKSSDNLSNHCLICASFVVRVSADPESLSLSLVRKSLCRLHSIPRTLIVQLAMSPPPPLNIANKVKNQPLPIALTRVPILQQR